MYFIASPYNHKIYIYNNNGEIDPNNPPSSVDCKTFHFYDDDGEISRTYCVCACTALLDIGFIDPELQERVPALLVVADKKPDDIESEEFVAYNWKLEWLKSDKDFLDMLVEYSDELSSDWDVLESVEF